MIVDREAILIGGDGVIVGQLLTKEPPENLGRSLFYDFFESDGPSTCAQDLNDANAPNRGHFGKAPRLFFGKGRAFNEDSRLAQRPLGIALSSFLV